MPERLTSPFAYPGVQIVHPRLFADPPEGAFSTNLMWNRAIAKGRLFGVRLDGVWIHVGTPEARAEAEDYLARLALHGAQSFGQFQVIVRFAKPKYPSYLTITGEHSPGLVKALVPCDQIERMSRDHNVLSIELREHVM